MSVNGSGALSGAASGAALGTAIMPGIGTAVGAVAGGLVGLFSKKPKAPTYQPLDISKIIADSREAAKTNYAGSIALEKEYNPQQAALRGVTNNALGAMAAGHTPGQYAANSLLSETTTSKVGDSFMNSLLSESADRILSNLRLGGTLGKDQQAVAVQAALQKGGMAGIGGSGAGRGLVARDLGLTSLQLEKDRIGQAQTAGTNLADLAMRGDALRLQDFLGRAGVAQNATAQEMQRTGLLASTVDSRALPEFGLSPGSIASLYVADNNAKNQVSSNSAQIDAYQSSQNLNALLGLGTAISKGTAGTGGLAGLFTKKPDTLAV